MRLRALIAATLLTVSLTAFGHVFAAEPEGPPTGDVTPIQCAKAAGGGIWQNTPAGSGQFLALVFPNEAGKGILHGVSWETPGLVRSDDRERYGTLSLGFFGIFLSAEEDGDPPLKIAISYPDALNSTAPLWMDATVRTDLIPGGETGQVVLSIDGGREWTWPYTSQYMPGQTGFGFAPVRLVQDPADSTELLAAVATGRTLRLVLKRASGAEVARLDATLPAAPNWQELRTNDVRLLLQMSNTGYAYCLDRIPFWFRWDDLKNGKVPFLTSGPAQRIDPATGKPVDAGSAPSDH